ncbi:unnamed protein product [Rotaria sordida]|uniref:Uncharacterized protein n=1 Tax=Rotaria sordida TaxID=392033 RepID=A0A813PI15_9BILA|nr:unnamed protein product [Rotaria sordida]CAF3472440.1 unnamed protein product [Rotaria sordida]
MADDDVEDTSPSASQPFFIRGGFPFVFLPTTFATGFTGENNHTRVPTVNDQTKTESKKEQVDDENSEEIKVEEEEEVETINNDETDRNNENDDNSNEKSDLRISQPEYSQLLKGLDFSHARMVDVTNLLPDEIDQQDDSLTTNENENPKKIVTNVKYQSSLSAHSSVSSDESLDNQMSNNNNNNDTDNNQAKEDANLINAAQDIQNDLNNLAAVIQAASQISIDNNEEESNNNLQKRHTFDEDDDTSKQATQNYDLNDFEPEEIVPSPTSSKIPRVISQQHSNDIQNENKSSIAYVDMNTNIPMDTENQTKGQQKQEASFFNWDNLVYGTDPIIQSSNEIMFSQPIIDSHSTPKKLQEQKPLVSSEEKPKQQLNLSTQQTIHHRIRRATLSSSSSSDTDSVIHYAFYCPKQKQPSPPPPQQQATPPIGPPQTLRQDSQATLTDENLDDLSCQLKKVHINQERQAFYTSTKEERTIDGIGSMPLPLSTPDILSTNLVDNDASNRINNNLVRHLSNQEINYNQQYHRHSSDIPEHSNPQKKTHHHHHHQRHVASRHFEHKDGNGSRKPDDNWLTMLERLEHEHKTRLEKQQQQYENSMHNLEEKMKRRFDDYLTLTNGFQESRSDNHDNIIHVYRTPSSVPIDSNIGRYKDHSHHHRHRHQQSLAKDLVSHYYPADSTLNILTSEKRRPVGTNNMPRSRSREDMVNAQTELSALHAKHIADLKLYYEYEINELKSQLNRARMGQTSSSTRQSKDALGRINNENIRLNDELNELRHALKTTEEENVVLKKQLEELREQINNKDLDLKNYHRTIIDLEKQLSEAENTKERQDEKFRHTDRQALLYQEENEKIKTDLNLTRERLLRLEERYNEQENENEILRRQLFMLENDSNRINNRMTDDHKFRSTMTLNQPTSRDYGHFALATTRHTSPTSHISRDTNIDSRRYQLNDAENSLRHSHSPRPMTRISDYLSATPAFPTPYIPPPRHSYLPRKSSPNHRRVEPMSNRTSIDRQTRQSEQLEQKFDQLLRRKRDLETRLNRIPLRGSTNIDRQLYDVLEREIERVEQQISSVKLELRKLAVLRTH